MVTNDIFCQYEYAPTQDMIEDLIIENIQINGYDFKYLPRTLVNEDKILGDERESAFNNAYTIEMYINTISGFEGSGDMISMFGLEIQDEMTVTVSKKRFTEETSEIRPNEGDLIYFPLSKTMFKIDFVEHENPFYQAGKLYTYALTCSTYSFSHESFDTNDPELSDLELSLDSLNNVLNDKYSENDSIDDEGDEILDFSESNPFGNY